jgi:hypothetical protein
LSTIEMDTIAAKVIPVGVLQAEKEGAPAYHADLQPSIVRRVASRADRAGAC